jgi:quinol-cytochrome oxidoreductase complex cytochrome b subunit
VKPKPKAGNKPLHHFIVHGLDKPGSSATVSEIVGILGFGVAGLFLLLVPFLDWRAARGQSSPLFSLIGLAMVVYMLLLTYLGYTMNPTQ